MDVNLKQINLDKSNWKLVKFGEIAKEPKENVKDIHAEGIEHVVGLEHIDSEDIHLRRSANIETSTTFTKKFATGDVLFGRRRAYLKKAAQAPFSGICSGDITVFRAKDSILPELLPFVVCNNKFFDYAVKHSAGGLSPRVKFKDLANYEFLLPPKNQQKQLAELLWAMDDVIEKDRVVEYRFSDYSEVILNSLFYKGIGHESFIKTKIGEIPESWVPEKLENLCIKIGDGIHKTPNYVDNSVYFFINGNNLIENTIKPVEGTKCVSAIEFEKYDKRLPDKSILMSINGTIGNMAIYSGEKVVFGKSVAFMVPEEMKLNYEFLFYLLQTQKIKRFYQRELTGTTISNLSLKSIRNTPVALPPINEQIEIAKKVKAIFKNIELIKSKIASSRALQKSLINQIF